MRFELQSSGELSSTFELDSPFRLEREVEGAARGYVENAAKPLKNPFSGLRFARIAAERDIGAEPDSHDLRLHQDGTGATNIVQRVINYEDFPSELVEKTLLDDLNKIMGPDAGFSRIAAQRTGVANWVIYLDEREKGRISLADSGSGLKTILLVLINMLVLPKLEKREPSDYVFAFEELENNLHPGLQRRLLKYVQEKLTETGAIGFVTTHSPAVIDMFSHARDAQILRVVHDRQAAEVLAVANSADGHGVLDDLDVRASDLLQANGIVWVEGISDVIYLRSWIELYCLQTGKAAPVEGS